MKLIVGLGNPGKEYENTRHNCGFIVLDRFANKHNLEFKLEPKFKGMISNVNFLGHKAILLKPMTYMNLSGESVIAVMNFYKINIEDILVISDDLDSPLARLRIRHKGSAGGHNGHKNIINHLKTEEYKRIKIGIDRDPNYSVVDWVLKKFTTDELISIDKTADTCCEAIEEFINEIDFTKIASKYSEK